MKQLFKMSLLAATVAATCGTAVAGTVTVAKQIHSTEGLAGITTTQTSESISYVVAAAYAVGDKITFTFPAGALVATTFPSQINVGAVDSVTETDTIVGMGLGLLNTDANTVTYRVTSLSQPDNNPAGTGTPWSGRTTIGATVTLGAIGYKAAALASGAVTVTVSSLTSVGDELDSSGTRTATVAEAKSQFGTVAIDTKFDAVINVSAARKAFVGVTSDSMSYTITNPATTGWLNLATVNATAGSGVTLFGEAGKMTGLAAANWSSVSGTRTFNEAAASLAISYNGMVTNDTITFTPTTGADADVLKSQGFTTDFVYNYTSAGATAGSKTIATGLASGAWVLNGATVNVPYMPYAANASQIMYVSNAGSQAGDIVVTAFDDQGKTYELGTIKVANANTVTKITAEVKTALELKGFTGGKVSLTVTVNAPAADITVYASYNAGGVRGYVNTDQYKCM